MPQRAKDIGVTILLVALAYFGQIRWEAKEMNEILPNLPFLLSFLLLVAFVFGVGCQ